MAYLISTHLHNVTLSNNSVYIYDNASFASTVSYDTIKNNVFNINITMGGVDISSAAYNDTTKTIYIECVTGDLVITASAVSETKNKIRQNIVIGPFVYIADLYKANITSPNSIWKNYVFVRGYDIEQDILLDSDIFIIDKDILLNNPDSIIFPSSGNGVTFGKSYELFNNSFLSSSFTKVYEDSSNANASVQTNFTPDLDVFLFRDSEGNEQKLLCDKFKIYHPHIISSMNCIVYVDLYINNIHLHLYTSEYFNGDIHSETEFVINNNKYSEYFEFYIPNIEYLLSDNVYYNETLVELYNKNITLEERYNNKYKHTDTVQSFEEVTNPLFKYLFENYFIDGDKKVINISSMVKQNISRPINLTLLPISEIINNNYVISGDYTENSDTFVNNISITLTSKLAFNENGELCLENKFEYPIYHKHFNSILEAYEEYNTISLDDYKYYWKDNVPYLLSNGTELVWENEEEVENNITMIGFEVEIFSDKSMQHLVHKNWVELFNSNETKVIDGEVTSILTPTIDDFKYSLNDIFTSWTEKPEILFAKVSLIDNIIGYKLPANFVIITKEYFKYLINDTNIYREKNLILKQMEFTNTEYFNFIDKINCIITDETTANEQQTIGNGNKPMIIYKPVFYKTADLQSIFLRNNITQNIGINLSNYMTKVETFKLILDNNEIYEYARNDVYVIFQINASVLTTASGTYDIVNQDDEYISSGAWTLN